MQAQESPAFLDFRAVASRIGDSPTPATRLRYWRGARAGWFPAPVELTPGGARVGWKTADVEAWIASRQTAAAYRQAEVIDAA